MSFYLKLFDKVFEYVITTIIAQVNPSVAISTETTSISFTYISIFS